MRFVTGWLRVYCCRPGQMCLPKGAVGVDRACNPEHPGRRRIRRRWAGWRPGPALTSVVCAACYFLRVGEAPAGTAPVNGLASWYGENHRGKLMANGKRFNPDKFTAASWYYPLGTKVKVTLTADSQLRRSVVVTITDRGPDKRLVRDGRIIDLSHEPFKRLAPPCLGLITVAVQPLR